MKLAADYHFVEFLYQGGARLNSSGGRSGKIWKWATVYGHSRAVIIESVGISDVGVWPFTKIDGLA